MTTPDVARLASQIAALDLALVRPLYGERGVYLDEEALLPALCDEVEKSLVALSPVPLPVFSGSVPAAPDDIAAGQPAPVGLSLPMA